MLLIFFAIFFLGVLMGYYLGNRKFRKAISRAIRAFKHRDEDEELYDYKDEDEG